MTNSRLHNVFDDLEGFTPDTIVQLARLVDASPTDRQATLSELSLFKDVRHLATSDERLDHIIQAANAVCSEVAAHHPDEFFQALTDLADIQDDQR